MCLFKHTNPAQREHLCLKSRIKKINITPFQDPQLQSLNILGVRCSLLLFPLPAASRKGKNWRKCSSSFFCTRNQKWCHMPSSFWPGGRRSWNGASCCCSCCWRRRRGGGEAVCLFSYHVPTFGFYGFTTWWDPASFLLIIFHLIKNRVYSVGLLWKLVLVSSPLCGRRSGQREKEMLLKTGKSCWFSYGKDALPNEDCWKVWLHSLRGQM